MASKSGGGSYSQKKISGRKRGTRKAETETSIQSGRQGDLNEDDNFYALVDIQFPVLIQLLASFSFIWEVVLYVTIVTNYILLTYGCFFTYFHKALWDIIFVTDCIYAVDVFLRIGVEMWRNFVQTDLLVFTLPYRFSFCVLDVLSLFPIYIIGEIASNNDSLNHLSHLDYFRLNSFIYLYRVKFFFDNIEELRLLSEEFLFVLRFSNLYLGFINIVSCIFFILTGVKPIDFLLWRNLQEVQSTWAKNFQSKKPQYGQEPLDLYILSTHFSTATVTTVGYGDVHAESEVEMMYCIVIMLIGAIFLNGYFISQITNFQLEQDGARYDLFFRLDAIKDYLTEAGMTPFFQAKVEVYYRCLWTYREGVDRVSFVDRLPRAFKEDIYYDVCLEMFHKSYLFRDLDEAFLRAVSRIVKIALYNPDMILCRYGGYANQMYYIVQGECQAMSKHESSKRAAILRAGSIIGETNLFFSCPYTVSVETNTCCQFISIDKEDLMSCFSKFPVELEVLRLRSQRKINQMYDYYKPFGIDPICWVQQKEVEENSSKPQVPSPVCTARWGDGLNQPVTEDVILDVNKFVIFETPCKDKSVRKNHVTPYLTCVVPEILNSELNWVLYWNIIIMVFALVYSFTGPYCLAFGASSRLERYICQANHVFQYVNMVMFILDVFVEVLGACPVEGIYYQFYDGLQMKSHEVLFYFDILAAAPVEPFQSTDEQDTLHVINVVLKSMKIWKVIRYLRFLDNIYPKDLFYFRLAQTFLVLMYGIHFISCIVFFLACPTDPSHKINCEDTSWIASFKTLAVISGLPVAPELEPDVLGKDSPYLMSFYFSAATLTSAGFGDFNPQNVQEIIWTIAFQLVGFFLIGYYTAVLTSALACTVKPRLEFQQRLVSIRRFMSYYNMPQLLQRRVVEHYELQHQFHNGVNLPPGVEHYLFDAPDYLKNDVLYTDVVLILDGIPLFSKTESKNIIKMSDLMRRYLIPPNVKFMHRGEVRRSMYAIRHGSIGVFDASSSTVPQYILESSAYFGMRDLLFGEPASHDFTTLSYCLIYEITNADFQVVFEDDEELMDHLNEHKDETQNDMENLRKSRALDPEKRKDRSIENPSWVFFNKSKSNKMEQLKYYEYVDFFNEFPGARFLRLFLVNGTVQETGLFAKLWSSWMSLAACIVICLLMLETFTYLRSPTFRIVQWILDLFFFMDIFVRLHWGYHLENGLSVKHPLKTAGRYFFEGSFFMDIILCAPVELIMFVFGYTNVFGYGIGATWFTKLRWIRIFQIKRVPQIFKIIHTIFAWRNFVLFILYVSVTILVCTIVASVALYIGCPWNTNSWSDGDEYRLPFCLDHTWASTKFGGSGATSIDVMADFEKRWVVGVYYVCQVILVIGFGDMITLTRGEIALLIFMSVFGFIFMRCVIADITAAEVDSDEIRSRYVDKMKRLQRIMTRENVNRKLQAAVQEHLNHTWKKSKGLQPRELFSDLHSALEADLYQSYVGDQLQKVPVFKDFASNVLRSLCQYVKKLYYLKGDRLGRFGNLEYEMHIIVSGRAWVTDKNLTYGCALHKNESFGETSVIASNARRFNFIAATNVEAFAITLTDFKLIMDRYPTVKESLKKRTGGGQFDYFEYKFYDMIEQMKKDPVFKEIQQKKFFQRTRIVRKLIYYREGGIGGSDDEHEYDDENQLTQTKKSRFKDLMKRFCSYGYEDDNLPFIYFVLQRSKSADNTTKLTWWPPLIHPNCLLVKWFLELIYVLCIFYPAVALYEVSFIAKEHGNSDYIGHFVAHVSQYLNYVLLMYIVLKFFLPFVDDSENYVKNSWAIVVNYVTSPGGAILDLIPLIAGFLTSVEASELEAGETRRPQGVSTRFHRLFSPFIFMWLVRYYVNHFSKRDDLSISAFRFKISVSISSFCLMAHILACVFYLTAECTHVDPTPCKSVGIHAENTWTHQFAEAANIESVADESMTPWRWWIRSLYWVVTVISTTGYGDITPQNVKEMIMGIICVFAGAFILSIILSHFTAGMASLTKAHREYLYQVKLLIKYLRNIGLSSLRQEQINFYFEMTWNACRGSMYHEAIDILPTPLQIEVAHALFEPVLRLVSFFNTDDDTFIRQVSARLIHSMYLPGVCIVKEGDQGDVMYIVYKGRVLGYGEEYGKEHKQNTSKKSLEHQENLYKKSLKPGKDPKERDIKNVYMVGDVFGKLPALFQNEWYKKSYRAEEPTEVLGLTQYDIMQLASIYEDFWERLTTYINGKYDPNSGSDPDGPERIERSDCIFVESRNKSTNLFHLDLVTEYRKGVVNRSNEHRMNESIKKQEQKGRRNGPHRDQRRHQNQARKTFPFLQPHRPVGVGPVPETMRHNIANPLTEAFASTVPISPTTYQVTKDDQDPPQAQKSKVILNEYHVPEPREGIDQDKLTSNKRFQKKTDNAQSDATVSTPKPKWRTSASPKASASKREAEAAEGRPKSKSSRINTRTSSGATKPKSKTDLKKNASVVLIANPLLDPIHELYEQDVVEVPPPKKKRKKKPAAVSSTKSRFPLRNKATVPFAGAKNKAGPTILNVSDLSDPSVPGTSLSTQKLIKKSPKSKALPDESDDESGPNPRTSSSEGAKKIKSKKKKVQGRSID